MRVRLIPPIRTRSPIRCTRSGLDYVAGAITERHPVCIVDMNAQVDGKALAKVIEGFGPEVIGLPSATSTPRTSPIRTAFSRKYKDLVDAIRAQTAVPLVLGGSGFAIFPEPMMRELGADYGIIGEGERLSLLLDALECRKRCRRYPASLPALRGGGTSAVAPQDHAKVRPMSAPCGVSPETGRGAESSNQAGVRLQLHLLDLSPYRGTDPAAVRPGRSGRNGTPVAGSGSQGIFVTDAAFNSSSSHSLAVAKAFKKAGVSIPWGAFFAPVNIDRDYFRILADAGLSHAEFGSESLSDLVPKAYRKPFRAENVFKAHAAAVEAGLHVAHYLLFGGPGEIPTL